MTRDEFKALVRDTYRSLASEAEQADVEILLGLYCVDLPAVAIAALAQTTNLPMHPNKNIRAANSLLHDALTTTEY